jgi:CubicO group peptidase (beta-lactamase class C family)
MPRRWYVRAGSIAVTVACASIILVAQDPKTDPARPVDPAKETPPPVSPREMTVADLEAFLDGLVPHQLDREDIAGAVITIVKDSEVLVAKGYGYADVAKKAPVTMDTLFRPGSISKLFTWTAVMQLVEQGKLDLDRDVNEYIDFPIPATFGKPITLRHLMTYTPGFEEAVKDLFVPDAGGLQPLKDYLVTHLPTQIFPPGTTPAYSNYGTALAGYIVERASGQPFEDYIEARILTPLGMTHSTFRQPLPASLQPQMSMGYARASEGAKSYEFVGAFPAGSMAVSARDMVHFMLAHLQDGEWNGARILKPETARLMHSRQFDLHPDMNGMALGFYEESSHGHRIIGHGGDTVFFHSDLHLLADERLGVFMSYNSAGKGESNPREALWQKFLDRYFPYMASATSSAPSGDTDDQRAVSGYYTSSRRAETTVIAFPNAVGQASVYTNTDGTISASFARGLNGVPQKFRRIAPMTFQDVDGQDRLAFQTGSGGHLTIVVPFPALAFQRTSGLRSRLFNIVVLIFSLGVITLTLLLWPVAALVRRHYGRRLETTAATRRFRRIVRIACGFSLASVLVAAYLASLQSTPGAFNARLDPVLRLMQLLALLGALGAVVAAIHAIRTLVSPAWWWTKIQEFAIALACAGIAWFVIYWCVLTPTLRY